MFYVCKRFSFDAGHRLLAHPKLCRHPHGHTYQLEVVLAAEELDENGMVCDYKALSIIVKATLAKFDHAMILNRRDPLCSVLSAQGERLVVLDDEPTAEVLAKLLFTQLNTAFADAAANASLVAPYRWRRDCQLVSVRVWETPKTWAEYRVGP